MSGTRRSAAARRDRLALVHPPSRAAWRAWLERHHASARGVWLAYDKKDTAGGKPANLSYDDAVEEALCFGWIDGVRKRLDARRWKQRFTPRKPRSAWSALNKRRVARLARRGLLAPAGRAAIAAAKRNGSWSSLDAIERLRVPSDLAAALRAVPAADRHFRAFGPSYRKGLAWYVASAKRPETRARRIAEVVAKAAVGRKAGYPERPAPGRSRPEPPARARRRPTPGPR